MIYLIWNRPRGHCPHHQHIVTAVRDGVWVATFWDMHDAEDWCEAEDVVWHC